MHLPPFDRLTAPLYQLGGALTLSIHFAIHNVNCSVYPLDYDYDEEYH